ncbi:MAG: hypothetical protein MUF34_08675, partial [Polyangiaceae bacterium]|nr:hypothetical protein [Polyangiaceae bacterium]
MRSSPSARRPSPSAALTLAFSLLLACGGDEANAPEGCRTIEKARCAQAVACPALGVSDVEACQRFYRDQCLRGLSTANDPGTPAIDACVRAIEGAGECARAGLVSAAECGRYQEVQPATPCEAIQFPERMVECSFLLPPPPPPVAGAAGA